MDMHAVHRRRSIRLKGYDYAGYGWYFVTLCAWQRECLFGEIVDGEMRLSDVGQLVESVWLRLSEHFSGINPTDQIVMPNHFHGIISFVGAGLGPPDGLGPPVIDYPTTKTGAASRAPTLGDVICAFKSISTRRVNQFRDNPGCPVWQRNYYERVIRNDLELETVRNYIATNPQQWESDNDNPRIVGAGLGPSGSEGDNVGAGLGPPGSDKQQGAASRAPTGHQKQIGFGQEEQG